MEAFWKWLMRANARAIFGGAVVGLLAVSGWWAWREFAPQEKTVTTPHTALSEQPQPGIGLVAFLDAQIEGYATALPSNPFFDETANRSRERPAGERPRQKPPRDNQPSQPPPGEQPPVAPAQPADPTPPPRKKEEIMLTYRGMFTRPDGKMMAVIEDSKSQHKLFYNTGTTNFGVTIGTPGEREARIVDAAGQEVMLPFGKAVKFEDGQYAD